MTLIYYFVSFFRWFFPVSKKVHLEIQHSSAIEENEETEIKIVDAIVKENIVVKIKPVVATTKIQVEPTNKPTIPIRRYKIKNISFKRLPSLVDLRNYN
jgi:hypothetical protein